MAKTKLGSASRFGARYGTPLKQVVKEIEETQKKKQICPQCGRKSFKRKGYAIWQCTKCNTKIAGGAYEPATNIGKLAKRIVEKEVGYKEIAGQIEKGLQEEKGKEEENKKKKEEE